MENHSPVQEQSLSINLNEEDSNLEEEVRNERDRVIRSNDDPIKAKYLTKQYVPNVNILKKLTFGVKHSEILGIIGPVSEF